MCLSNKYNLSCPFIMVNLQRECKLIDQTSHDGTVVIVVYCHLKMIKLYKFYLFVLILLNLYTTVPIIFKYNYWNLIYLSTKYL